MWQPAAIPHTVFDRPCLDFVNSKFSEVSEGREEYDRLDLTEWRRWFLERWDLPATAQVSQTTLRRLKALRKDLRWSLEQRRTSEAELQRFNAVLAATPGALTQMVALAIETDSDSVGVSIAQTLRVVLLVAPAITEMAEAFGFRTRVAL